MAETMGWRPAPAWRLGLLTAGLGLLAAACTPNTPEPEIPPPPVLAVSPGLEPWLRPKLEAYRSEVGLPAFDLDLVPWQAAQQGIRRGELALAVASSAPPSDWFATPLGTEPLVLVVHPENRLPGLTSEQAEGLLSGELAEWSDLGLDFEPEVHVYLPFPGDDLRQVLADRVMRGRRFTPGARLFVDPALARSWMADDPGSLGLLPLSAVTPEVRALRLDGRLPSDGGSSNAGYRLMAPIVATSPEEPSGGLRQFLGWLQETSSP